MNITLDELRNMRKGGRKFQIILIDPLGHSFISNPYHPEEDKRCTI
jgi:C4-type Zn-finger protein